MTNACPVHPDQQMPCLACALLAVREANAYVNSPSLARVITTPEALPNPAPGVAVVQPWQKQLSAIFKPNDYLCIFLVHGTETYVGKDGKPHPKVEEHWDTFEGVTNDGSLTALKNWEAAGWNIFVCTAVFDQEKVKAAQAAKQRRRVPENIATDSEGKHIVRCVAIDCDVDGKASLNKIGEAVKAEIVPMPTIVVRSSAPPADQPDRSPKYHVWWATENLTLEQQAALNAALQQEFGGDPAAKDVVRVLRLAGFVNNQPTKYPHKPVAELVRCNDARYAFEDFKLSVDVKPLVSIRAKASSDRLEFYCNQIETNATEAGFDLGDAEPYLDGGFKWVQTECPNADAHTTGGRNGSFLILMPSGAKSFGCLHAHCKGEKDGTLLDWEWFKNHLNKDAGKELDWTDKGMLIVSETTSVVLKNEEQKAAEAYDALIAAGKAKTLFVFANADDVAVAKSESCNAVLAADLRPPFDDAFEQIVFCGSPTAADVEKINDIQNEVANPDEAGRAILAHLVQKSEGTSHLRLVKKGTKLVEESANSAITVTKRVADSIEVKPETVQVVSDLLFNNAEGRESQGLPQNSKKAANLADKIVYDDLKIRGKFYNANGLGCLVLHGMENTPIKISEHEADCLDLLEKYELHAGRPETNAIGKFLGVRANKDGERVSMSISFHYNPKTRTAYYAEQSGVLLKVTRDGVTKIRNGEDGVLFTYPEKYEPWEFSSAVPAIASSLIPAHGSALYEGVFKGLLLEDSAMSDEQKHILLTAYLILLFLPGLNKSKILLQMQGPSGSGKSFFLETIGRMLLGPQFTTQPMPSDVREFENQVVNSSYIAYDNVNKIDPAIKDLLCQVATGLTVTRRELFTTSGEVKLPALATVALSCINPVLAEVEHANRSLILTTKPRDSFYSSVDLLGDLDKQRGAIMSEIVHRVRMVLEALDAQRNYRPKVNMRLADVATFLLRVARHEGWEDRASELLSAWADDQSSSAMADDDIGQAMVYVLRNPDYKSVWKTSSDFRNMLVSAATQAGMALDWWATRPPKTLLTMLVKNAASYQRRYGLEFETDATTKNRCFRLNPSPELLAAVRKPWKQSD